MATERSDALLNRTGGEPDLIERTPSAYGYPLLVKHLLHAPLAPAPEQEIVYRDLHRYDYRTLQPGSGSSPAGSRVWAWGPETPWLTQGYLKKPEKSEELWEGGYLHTEDIGYIDPEGYLQVTDRIKDVIKTGGEWVSSQEIEDILSQHEGVSEAAVIGVEDEKWGERPLAVIAPKADHADEITEEEIKAHVKERAEGGEISKFAVPDRIWFVEEIDKTSVGKIDKKTLREKYAE